MMLTPTALVLLNAQRQFLSGQPQERVLARDWAHHVDEARAEGWLIAYVQWDGRPADELASGPADGSPAASVTPEQAVITEQAVSTEQDSPEGAWSTFSKAWTLHPDFRAEAGDVLVRAELPDAFSGSDLSAQLHARAVRTLWVLALPDTPELQATLDSAREQGFEVAQIGSLPLETTA